ncbi:hypothetical protein A6D6_03716 [Alcanivorax xiamenensis]|uniref:Uncharacterized protein n=1 Tax=Alcanivorax xiamenensis TaxID=1177156 RepID=A0ABQ6Y3U1_9GAMM|nr:hypothetical protein A6D6_03716 [Alcanivorax xiamenensis]
MNFQELLLDFINFPIFRVQEELSILTLCLMLIIQFFNFFLGEGLVAMAIISTVLTLGSTRIIFF